MPSWQRDVFSTMVSQIAWEGEDPLSGTMTIYFVKGGRIYEYPNVPEDVAIQLTKAPSCGDMVNTEIKGQYSFRRIA